MNQPSEATSILTISDYLAMLKRRWWVLILVPVLAGFVASRMTTVPVPIYTATSSMLVSPGSLLGQSDVRTAATRTQLYGILAVSRPVLDIAVSSLEMNGELTSDQLGAMVYTTTAGAASPILYIHASSDDPQQAALFANAVSNAFATWLSMQQTEASTLSSEALQQTIDEAWLNIEATSQQIAELESKPGELTPEEASQLESFRALLNQYRDTHGSLLQLQQQMELSEFNAQSQISQLAPAEPPPLLPEETGTKLRNIVLAIVLGFGSAAAGIVLLERANVRIHLPDDVRRHTALPVLAAIPEPRWRTNLTALSKPDSPASEAVRLLRTRLQFAVNGKGLGTIAVTSPGWKEGKSQAAANLAASFAQAGVRVIFVDGHLRNPAARKLFGLQPGPGLAELLVALREDPDNVPNIDSMLADGPVSGMRVLLAGTPPPAAGELMTGERMRTIISCLRSRADLVIIDTPPLLNVSDAMILTAAADHVVLVAKSGGTKPDALDAAAGNASSTNTDLLGVVVTGTEAWRRPF